MLTLGIESSCDETAVALICNGRMIRQELYSQAQVHALFGGVIPELASREHYTALSYCMEKLFLETEYNLKDVDCISVARGPGLLGSLLVGIAFAKGLAFSLQKPLVGVNHLHAHIAVAGLEFPLQFPFLGILLSGGHTYTYYCTSYTDFSILGRTLDDAVGEVLDKIGKMLGMAYPAGKCIEEFAMIADSEPLFTNPYCNTKTMDYSFSGLKTQALHYIRTNPECIVEKRTTLPQENPYCATLCASLLRTVTATIQTKIELALQCLQESSLPCYSLVLGGGVAANSFIRTALKNIADTHSMDFFTPHRSLCTDNAYMIAALGEQLIRRGLYHTHTLSAIPRGQSIPFDYLQ